jgi:hypothetical protein
MIVTYTTIDDPYQQNKQECGFITCLAHPTGLMTLLFASSEEDALKQRGFGAAANVNWYIMSHEDTETEKSS